MSTPDQVVMTEPSNVATATNDTNDGNVIANTNNNTCSTTAASTSPIKPKTYYRLTRILRKPKSTVKPHPWRRATQSSPQENNNNTSSKTEEEEEEQQQQTVHVPEDEDKIGFSLTRMQELMNSLTPAERQRARAELAPLSQTQEALAQRAARFGLSFNTPVETNPIPGSATETTTDKHKMARVETTAVPLDMSDETLQRRETRFKTPEQVEMELQMQRRAERFGTMNSTACNETTTSLTSSSLISNQVQSNVTQFASNTKQSTEIKLSDADRAAMEARAKRFGM